VNRREIVYYESIKREHFCEPELNTEKKYGRKEGKNNLRAQNVRGWGTDGRL
jgi:hypothetical protein